MKRWFLILVIMAMLPAWYDASASGPPPSASHDPVLSTSRDDHSSSKVQRFVDEDGDGLNDLVSDSDGDGIPNGRGIGHAQFGTTRPAQIDIGISAHGSGMSSGRGKGGGR